MAYRKKLIEVALPLEAINRESAREKSIRHGHPSTLHLWWARRPLAACRAVLFASLVDDPDSDPAYRKPDGSVDEDRAGVKRAELFNLIEELVKWDNSNNEKVINSARAEIARCIASRKIELGEFDKATIIHGPDKGKVHPKGPIPSDGRKTTAWEVLIMRAKPEVVNAFLTEFAPPVLDPFCGGGSIPLEAQRLGLRAYASDLNPVPVLINKAMIEIPPVFAGQPPVNPTSNARLKDGWKGAQGLAEDVRYYATWMRNEAEKRIGHLYPKVKVTAAMAKARTDLKPYVGEDLTVDAWLWARTFVCINPSCRGTIPMVTTGAISRRPPAFLTPVVLGGRSSFQISSHATDFEGTQCGRGAKFKCPYCGSVNGDEAVRAAAQAGQMASTLTSAACSSQKTSLFLGSVDVTVDPIEYPDIPGVLDQEVSREHRCVLYGFRRFPSLFSPRQLKALLTFSELVAAAQHQVLQHSASTVPAALRDRYAEAVALYLAFAVDRAADYWSQMTTWMPRGTIRQTFARQRIAMNWDWAEANPFGAINCAWDEGVDWIVKAIQRLPMDALPGNARQVSATSQDPGMSPVVISTDPPYYDNIPYADCSDYFYVWMRHSLATAGGAYANLLGTLLTPKSDELVASAGRHDGSREAAKEFFEAGLGNAFVMSQRIHDPLYPLTVYYAFKQTESDEDNDQDFGSGESVTASTGWETMLTGLAAAGLSINGTWPIRTEREARNISIGTNALASSIVLSCRSRPESAPLATRREFINALKRELPDALKHLQRGSIAPVDLAQAAIGPGMSVFTRYAKVMEADGTPMKVRQALALINQMLDEVLAEQEGEFDSDTRWALAWFEQYSIDEGPFGVAETLSRAKNTAVNALVEAGIVRAHGGKVRLLKRSELHADWNPVTDSKVRHWEITQHLIRALETGGETAAADLLRKVGGMGEVARDLAYRLYSLCERKKWAQEAISYNGLVIAWPEISKLAQSAKAAVKREAQPELFKEGQ